MPVQELTQDFIDNGLYCPEDKSKIEYRDTVIKGLMINLTAKGHASFVVRYRADGKYQYLTLGSVKYVSLEDARMKAEDIFRSAIKGEEPHKRVSIPLFSDFFTNRYMPDALLRKRSAKNDQQLFDTHLDREFGHLRLDQINASSVEKFHMKLHKSGRAPSTTNHYIKLLRRCMNLAVHWGIIESNPLSKVQLLKEDNQVEHYMDEKQLERMLLVLNTHENRVVANMIKFMLSTGCRRMEAFTVRWQDIDLDNRVWLVRAQISKSGKRRSIPLSDSALDIIDALETRGKYEYLFVNRRTKSHYRCIKTTWSKIRDLAGVSHLRLHDLRHQFASLMANGGRSLFEIQAVLGHSDPKVTMRYSHLQKGTLNEAVNSISDKLSLPTIQG